MKKLPTEQKKLIRRYLIWFYKQAKEEFEKTERKFTQLCVDCRISKELSNSRKHGGYRKSREYNDMVDGFKHYVEKKEEQANELKFLDSECNILSPGYTFLKNRLSAVEKTIVYFLGKKELQVIDRLYQDEMVRRILESREH